MQPCVRLETTTQLVGRRCVGGLKGWRVVRGVGCRLQRVMLPARPRATGADRGRCTFYFWGSSCLAPGGRDSPPCQHVEAQKVGILWGVLKIVRRDSPKVPLRCADLGRFNATTCRPSPSGAHPRGWYCRACDGRPVQAGRLLRLRQRSAACHRPFPTRRLRRQSPSPSRPRCRRR